jgi:hypothetical protein
MPLHSTHNKDFHCKYLIAENYIQEQKLKSQINALNKVEVGTFKSCAT